jgi:hypothetical protein
MKAIAKNKKAFLTLHNSPVSHRPTIGHSANLCLGVNGM